MNHGRMRRSVVLLIVLTILVGIAGCGKPQPQTSVDCVVVSGSVDNEVGDCATVSGGSHNAASAFHAVVGGGSYNTAGAAHSVVGGGTGNVASSFRTTVGGGYGNIASHLDATVSGGNSNTASSRYTTVAGGSKNTASGFEATVSGGANNTANGIHATVSGGTRNDAAGFDATISGGVGNTASAARGTVGGGLANHATGIYGTIGGGYGNVASGSYATVPGGFGNTAGGDNSFATGRRAIIDTAHDGAFLYADSSDVDFRSATADEFAVRATGGVRFVAAIDDNGDPVGGVTLAPGSGSWSSLSDRDAKMHVAPADGARILALLAELPISTWNYAGQDPSIRHVGPMAQDFHAAFGVGEDEKHISAVDADGVALAAIQELYNLTEEKDAQITLLEARVTTLERASKINGYCMLAAGLCLANMVLVCWVSYTKRRGVASRDH